MFGTWKYGRASGQVESLKISHDYETARSSQHQACNRCHEKKLKCSGEKDGCERCTTQGLSCEYSRSGSRHSKKHRKTEAHSSSSSRSGRDGSGSPRSSYTSHPSSSKDKRSSHTSGTSRAGPSATNRGTHSGNAGPAVYGMGAFDGYQTLPATTEPQAAEYSATAPISGYTTAVDEFGNSHWILDDGTGTTDMNDSFLTTSQSMYTGDAAAWADFSDQSGYDMYQNTDPSFWDPSQHQH